MATDELPTLTDRLPTRADGGDRRRLMRYDPTINGGHVLQILVLLLGGAGAYGAYTADRRELTLEVVQIKKDAGEQRQAVKEAITDLRSDVKDVQRSLSTVNESLAVLKARPEVSPPQQQPRPPR